MQCLVVSQDTQFHTRYIYRPFTAVHHHHPKSPLFSGMIRPKQPALLTG
eukprot:COSAG02_NODE_55446_length_290_cov_1.089005_1_plen_48_part_01